MPPAWVGTMTRIGWSGKFWARAGRKRQQDGARGNGEPERRDVAHELPPLTTGSIQPRSVITDCRLKPGNDAGAGAD